MFAFPIYGGKMKKFCVIVFLFLLIPFIMKGQEGKLYLIPEPQKIEYAEGKFIFPGMISIGLRDKENKEDKFAALQVAELLTGEMKYKKAPIDNWGGIILGTAGKNKTFDSDLKNAGVVIPESLGDEGYLLKVTPKQIIIAGKTSQGVFYGVQTLKQIIRGLGNSREIPCMTITDWPALKYRGWMDDISRGPIPTMDYLKYVIRTLSEYKLNYFTLYTEHTFRLKRYPDISPQDGITAEEIAELTEYAKDYHIEIVGNAQSFGHMNKILSIPFYRYMGENADVLNPAIEETYRFLENMYSEIAPAYSNSFFNINCDETYGLGTGGAKKMVDSIGQDGVYAYHINRIDKILKKFDKKIMMWGDIAVNNKNIIDRLPKDMTILSWGYHAAESFDDAILPFKNSGFNFMVAPGVSCWSEVWPNMTNAAINISNYIRDGYKLGAMGVMNTAWDDDGENLFNYNWHGLIWGAECSWHPASPLSGGEAVKEREEKLKKFNTAFDVQFFGMKNLSAVNTLLGFDVIRKIPVKNIVRDEAVWSSMLDLFPDNVNEAAVSSNREAEASALKLIDELKNVKKEASKNAFLLDHAIFAAERVLFTAKKNLVRAMAAEQQARKLNNTEDKIKTALLYLSEDLHKLKKEYVRLWNLENRGWWLDRVLAKYDRLGEQILNFDKTVFIGIPEEKNGKQTVEISTLFEGKDIYYTLNGEEPSIRSFKYTRPVELVRPTMIKARVIEKGEKYPAAEKYFLYHKGIGKLQKIDAEYSRYNAAYSGGGINALVDGLTGSESFADGRWQGFQGQDVTVILDLKEKTPFNAINMSCLQNSYSWILMPAKVMVYSSDDGINYALLKEIPNVTDPKADGAVIANFASSFTNTSARYLKVVAVSQGDLPKWHHAAGNKSFIFADEIVIE